MQRTKININEEMKHLAQPRKASGPAHATAQPTTPLSYTSPTIASPLATTTAHTQTTATSVTTPKSDGVSPNAGGNASAYNSAMTMTTSVGGVTGGNATANGINDHANGVSPMPSSSSNVRGGAISSRERGPGSPRNRNEESYGQGRERRMDGGGVFSSCSIERLRFLYFQFVLSLISRFIAIVLFSSFSFLFFSNKKQQLFSLLSTSILILNLTP
jgi:hypothetical protein